MNLSPLHPWIRTKISAASNDSTGTAIAAYQVEKLNETLAWARAKSRFYRDAFAGLPETIAGLEDLAHFPFTTPEDIRRAPLAFVCVSQDEIGRVVTLQSSGTTGEPKRIYFTPEDQELTIDFFKVGMSTLTGAGERVLILLPGEKPGSVGDLLRLGLERLGAQPIPHGALRHPQETLDVMRKNKVDCVVGSPLQLNGLARRWNRGGYAPHSVLLSTDYVPAAIIKTLEDAFGCEVFNHYGTTEMGLGGGVECAAHRGYHLREADLYFEVVDSVSGRPVRDGEYGEVVFTTLTRQGMPLIRYRTGDRSRFVPEACPCGAPLNTLERVRGRFSGIISLDGETLMLPELDEVLFPIPGLLNFSSTITGDQDRAVLTIESEMLSGEVSAQQMERMLDAVPFIQKNREKGILKLIVHCRYNPEGAASLAKRVIFDKRGHHA